MATAIGTFRITAEAGVVALYPPGTRERSGGPRRDRRGKAAAVLFGFASWTSQLQSGKWISAAASGFRWIRAPHVLLLPRSGPPTLAEAPVGCQPALIETLGGRPLFRCEDGDNDQIYSYVDGWRAGPRLPQTAQLQVGPDGTILAASGSQAWVLGPTADAEWWEAEVSGAVWRVGPAGTAVAIYAFGTTLLAELYREGEPAGRRQAELLPAWAPQQGGDQCGVLPGFVRIGVGPEGMAVLREAADGGAARVCWMQPVE